MHAMCRHVSRTLFLDTHNVSSIVVDANSENAMCMANCRHCEAITYTRAVALQQELKTYNVEFSLYESVLCCLLECDSVEEIKQVT